MALFLRIIIYGGIPVIIALAIYGYISSLSTEPAEAPTPTISTEISPAEIMTPSPPEGSSDKPSESIAPKTSEPITTQPQTPKTPTSTSSTTTPKDIETDEMTRELDALIDDIVGN